MSGLIRSRAGLLTGVAGLAGFIFYQTAGGSQQPNSRAQADGNSMDISGSLQSIAGTGGKTSQVTPREEDPKDTKLYSRDPTAHTKKSPQKTTDDLEGGTRTSKDRSKN